MDLNLFFIEDNKIKIYKYKCIYTQQVWDYSKYDEETFRTKNRTLVPIEQTIYLAESSNIPNNTPESFKHDFVDKHAKLNITSITPLEVSDIEWLDNIPVADNYLNKPMDYIEYLLSIGKEAYEQSLVTTPEDYMTDLDYRISLLELGLGGETS